mmetsp:Transcript_15340/g.43514  ORF Transcript_15340/g.43514 Transcript_15340/m.43514 type:complete len:225 (+) Transcript_15340:214-888(+)
MATCVRQSLSNTRLAQLGAQEWLMRWAVLPARVASTTVVSLRRNMYVPAPTMSWYTRRSLLSATEGRTASPMYSTTRSPALCGTLQKRPMPWMALLPKARRWCTVRLMWVNFSDALGGLPASSVLGRGRGTRSSSFSRFLPPARLWMGSERTKPRLAREARTASGSRDWRLRRGSNGSPRAHPAFSTAFLRRATNSATSWLSSGRGPSAFPGPPRARPLLCFRQ